MVPRVNEEAPAEVDEIASRRKVAANIAHASLSIPDTGVNRATVVVISFLAFVVASLGSSASHDIGILIGVILFHEGGHLLGMWLFGFSDLRMLFLPFLGAAVSGNKPGASAVERAIVSLLGPVPGLLLALGIACFADPGTSPKGPLPVAANIVVVLVLLNGFNLIPILPLDGGRLFQQLLFARTPILDIAFRVLAIGGIAWFAWSGHAAFWAIALLMFLSLQRQARLAFEGARLRRQHRYPPDVSALSDEDLAQLHDAAVRTTSHLRTISDATRKRLVQLSIRDLFERVAQESPKLWQTVLLLLTWALAFVAGAAALFVMFRLHAHR